MLYGIISDIHGNLEALDVVLNKLSRVDKLVCLGDIVGYGPNPNECVEKIRELKMPCVLGNHEAVGIGKTDSTWFNSNARAAIQWTQRVIFQDNLDYLRDLPLRLEEDGFEMVHGSLRNPIEEYITSIADALPTFKKMVKPICFVGHSHIPLYIALKKDGNYVGGDLSDGEEILTDEYEKVIINVGAVGQPRDKDPRASFGIYDSKTRLFSLHRVVYNIDQVQQKMKAVGLPQRLIDRLATGK
ncbi:MAG: metallophosphatase family protein [Candidatus Margulisbacteria bacterium]|nr:metallophosphatase family protein [Candidatus Margulisiibacteriota bacterium]